MNFFDIIRSLFFFRRNGLYEELDHDCLQLFMPFLLNRWLSFSDRAKAVFVNETYNKFAMLFENKSDHYKFYYHLTPRSNFKKIAYVKKNKVDKADKEKAANEANLKLFASNNLLSTRELNMYLALQNNKSI